MDADRLKNAENLKKQLEDQARFQQEINGSLEDYLKGVERVNSIKQSILTTEKNIQKVEEDIKRLSSSTAQEDIKRVQALEDTKELLKIELELIKKTHKEMSKIVKETKTWKMFTAEAIHGTGKMLSNISKIPGKFNDIMSPLKDLFEMDKSIRRASLQMGLIGSQSDNFRKNIKLAAEDTQKLGMGIKELAEMQAQYSENIGRNVSLGKEGLVALSQIAEGTSLGAEATAQMAADFESQGVSAVKTRDAMEEAANRASSMGLNSAKVVKNIAQNAKMLNKFRFKDGVKGLVKMAELSAKLGVDMDFASGFAEKLWNVEGAVETAAQFNVMGGAFARLGDPFKLMYMARNDIAGLTEEIANAASESAVFNKETGKFELGAMEMHRLKIIAEQTGLEYDKLVTAGQNAAKFARIKTQVSFSMNDEAKEFLANTAQLDEQGRAYIEVKGEKKFLSTLGASGAKLIQDQIKEKKTLEERAKAAKSFDEQIVNLINQVKTFMLPIVEGLTDVLKPFVEELMGNKEFMGELKSLGATLGEWVKTAATWFKGLAEIAVAIGPKGIFAAWLAGKGVMALFDLIKWAANGVALGEGFLKATGGFGGGGSDLADSLDDGDGSSRGRGRGRGRGGRFGRFGTTRGGMSFGKSLTRGLGAGAITGLASYGMDYGRSKMDDPNSTGGKLLGAGSKALEWGSYGAMLGSVIPGLGTAAGGIIGGLLGGAKGLYDEFNNPDAMVNDGIIQFNKNDKFTKVNDSTMVAGTNKNGNKELAQVLKYGMMAATPLGGLSLLASGMNKALSGGLSSDSKTNKLELGELKITGEIKLTMPDGSNIGRELINNPEFKASITRVVTSQLEKNKNGGKTRG
jgi:hypothetical protein